MDTVLFAFLVGGLLIAWLVLRDAILPLLWHFRNYLALRSIPSPGPKNWFDGHLAIIRELGSDIPRWERWLKSHRRIIRTRLFYINEINLIHPETASLLLKTAEPKSELYSWLRTWLGDGLLLSTGKRWARDRRLLTRGFHFDILRGYMPIYKEATNIMLNQWSAISRRDDGGTVNVSQCSKLLTLDVILRCIMSFKSNCQTAAVAAEGGEPDDLVKYALAVQELGRCLFLRTGNAWEYSDFLFNLSANGRKFKKLKAYCHTVSRRVIRERRLAITRTEQEGSDTDVSEDVGNTTGRYLDFLDILLTARDDDGKGMTDQEIQEQVDTFLFEGHDTTASVLQWTLYNLAKHPHLQEKCRQEVQGTLDGSKELSYEQLGKLQYLTQFIKETMRLGGGVPYIGRVLTQPLTIDNYTIPPGTLITIPILAIHRNPDVWEEPLEFNPERFSLDEVAKRHPFAFIPFSGGPRNCIGQTLVMEELKSVIALVLMRFRLTHNPSAPEPVLTAELVSRSLHDIQIYAHEI